MMEPPRPPWDDLAAWCGRWLGAPPGRALVATGHLAAVTGLELVDGRRVVVKVRPPAVRLAAGVAVQQQLWAVGFPYPRVLAGPAPLGVPAGRVGTRCAGCAA